MDSYEKFAKIYDRLIYEDIDYKSWAKFILDLNLKLDINKENYLDIGCGTGNMAAEICSSFKNCFCVDISEDMLMIAQEKFREKRLMANFICQDMRELKLNKKFDLITCCLDCTNYLAEEGDLDTYLNKIYELLKDDGIYIFDINSEYKLREVMGENIFSYNEEDVVYLWENRTVENIEEMYLTFFIQSHGSTYERFEEIHRERIYSQEEITASVEKNNMKVLYKFQNYTFGNVDSKTQRITYVVSKKGKDE
ncbi:class I SAM-dependent methyltransferase [Clostridium sp. 19966]|uniref:class I SAM-dependent DNA methyltransferase n=1 Tax=Clostridium sp. 19966 TaxID=2768166 RepID=UPI0028DE5042|nr:class I SAM-dependent methyltransferase [Clostridium sp. 19966]MDT8716532.1 class I SAM-dependent methyltransferase [Clostridium sp. 19966]